MQLFWLSFMYYAFTAITKTLSLIEDRKGYADDFF